MLSFDSTLAGALKSSNTSAFWVLKLYYNAAGSGDFLGLSDSHRIDGDDIYHPLIAAWGSYNQSLDFFNHSTGTANMSVKIINTKGSLFNGRFSDYFAGKNFANRAWELFINTQGVGTLDLADRMIGSGVISGGLKYNMEYASVTLMDKSSKLFNIVPTGVITSTGYPNAPDKNIGKPLPMAYGSFLDRSHTKGDDPQTISGPNTSITQGGGSTAIPSNYFGRHITHKFPAPITNRWYVGAAQNSDSGYVQAKADRLTIGDIKSDNVYMYTNGHYAACDTSNSNVSISEPTISFRGSLWWVYVPISKAFGSQGTFGTYTERMIDGRFDTAGQLIPPGGGYVFIIFGLGKMQRIGTISTMYFLQRTAKNLGQAPSLYHYAIEDPGGTSLPSQQNATTATLISTNQFSVDRRETWDFEDSYLLVSMNQSPGTQLWVQQYALEVGIKPENTFEKDITELYETTVYKRSATPVHHKMQDDYGRSPTIAETKTLARTVTVLTPQIGEYVYYSGEGRKYGNWIDGIIDFSIPAIAPRDDGNGSAPDPGYGAGAIIVNPVYQIESILREECGLDENTIDPESFDLCGNATSGTIKNSLGTSTVAEIEFSWCQFKFIDAKELIDRIASLSGLWVFISGNGKIKAKSKLRPSGTMPSDKDIDYTDIELISISRTPLDNVRNSIKLHFDYDYGADQCESMVTATDSTTQGDGARGVDATHTLEVFANEILDVDTAQACADMYLANLKEQKPILEFKCLRPYYNDLEIGDIIGFENWDLEVKIYGETFLPVGDNDVNNDMYIITEIRKRVDGCTIKATKAN